MQICQRVGTARLWHGWVLVALRGVSVSGVTPPGFRSKCPRAWSLAAIHRAREAFEQGELRQRLARHHGDNVDRAFRLWADAWVAPGFQPMDINRLPRIEVPVEAIQGEDDDYGSELQLGIIAGKVGGYCETRLVPDCGHSPHLQQPAYVLGEIARFVAPLALVG